MKIYSTRINEQNPPSYEILLEVLRSLNPKIEEKEIIISENDSMDGWIEYGLLGSNLYQTGLSLKTVEILQNVGIVKVGELISHTKMQIASINGIGEQKLKKIGDFLADTNLNYGTEVRERNGKWYIKAVTE